MRGSGRAVVGVLSLKSRVSFKHFWLLAVPRVSLALRLEVCYSETFFWALKGSIVAPEGFGRCLICLVRQLVATLLVPVCPGGQAASWVLLPVPKRGSVCSDLKDQGLLHSAVFAQAGYFQMVVKVTSLIEDQQSRLLKIPTLENFKLKSIFKMWL